MSSGRAGVLMRRAGPGLRCGPAGLGMRRGRAVQEPWPGRAGITQWQAMSRGPSEFATLPDRSFAVAELGHATWLFRDSEAP